MEEIPPFIVTEPDDTKNILVARFRKMQREAICDCESSSFYLFLPQTARFHPSEE
jgi:hypothetical protein